MTMPVLSIEYLIMGQPSFTISNIRKVPIQNIFNYTCSGFGGLEDACWRLVPKFAGSNPAEAIGFFRAQNPQHAFLRGGSKAGGPMS
jgi:hypothetical protein